MPANKPKRKLDPRKEVDSRLLYDDPRSAFDRFAEGVSEKGPATVVVSCIVAIVAVAPISFLVLGPIGAIIWAGAVDAGGSDRKLAPMRLPADSGMIDLADPKPGRKAFNKARGTVYLGNRMGDDAEVWQASGDAVRHWLVFGTTGAGKAQPFDELVLTPTGFRPIGEISPGDLVINADGEKATVIEVHPQGVIDVFELTTGDGRSVRACADHLWVLVDGRTLSTTELVAELGAKPQRPVRLISGSPMDGEVALDALLGDRTLRTCVYDWVDGESVPPNDVIPRLSRRERLAIIGALLTGCQITRVRVRCGNEAGARFVQEILWSCGAEARVQIDTTGDDPRWVVHISHDELPALVEGMTVLSGVSIDSVTRLERPTDCVCLELDSPKAMYITRNYVATHNTNTLLSVAVANALAMSSGIIYSDAKASPDLAYKVASMARKMGRDDDLFILNYITGAGDRKDTRHRMSNTSNPFEEGPADSKVQVMSGLMPKSEGDNAIFGERAIALLTAVMYPLVDLRDAKYLNLGVNEIADALQLNNLLSYATDPNLPISKASRDILRKYLMSLPGFDMKKLDEAAKAGDLAKFALPQEAARQFGFSQMYFTRAISSLADTYGHIYCVNMGELDYTDAVLNRRIVVIMLPALEKSLPELGNLGKINLSALRDAMKVGLGRGIEGDRELVLDAVPTASKVPVVICLDEVAYQLVEGFAVTAAQARGLNIQVIFAGQDYAGIKKASEGEAQQIVENTNTKVFMKLEGAGETFEMLQKSAGEATIAQAEGGERLEGSITPGRFSKQAYRFDKQSRVDISDMRDLVEGEAYITFGARLIQANMAHSDVKLLRNLRINRYLRISPPPETSMPSDQTVIAAIDELMRSRFRFDDQPETVVPADLSKTIGLLTQMESAGLAANVRGIVAVSHLLVDAGTARGQEGGPGVSPATAPPAKPEARTPPASTPAAAPPFTTAATKVPAGAHGTTYWKGVNERAIQAAKNFDASTMTAQEMADDILGLVDQIQRDVNETQPAYPKMDKSVVERLSQDLEAYGDEDFIDAELLGDDFAPDPAPQRPAAAIAAPRFGLEDYIEEFISGQMGDQTMPTTSAELSIEAAELIRAAGRYPAPPLPPHDEAARKENMGDMLNALLITGSSSGHPPT